MLVHELIEEVKERATGTKVDWVGIGVSYVGVISKRMGLAYVFRDELGGYCKVTEMAGEFPKDVESLIRLATSTNALDSAVGIATINSLIEPHNTVKGDVIDLLEVRSEDRVGMVGFFRPFVDRLRSMARELYIFERGRFDSPFVYPDWAAELLLPKVDIAIITGTSIINKTLDHLLELASNARTMAVVGPSTPLIPGPFRKRGVKLLSGMVVKDFEKAKEIISQGGGTRKLAKVSEKVNLIL
jgi:hypothetical protein